MLGFNEVDVPCKIRAGDYVVHEVGVQCKIRAG